MNNEIANYHYKAYIKNLLGLGSEPKNAQNGLYADNFARDSAGNFEKNNDSYVNFFHKKHQSFFYFFFKVKFTFEQKTFKIKTLIFFMIQML